MTSFDEFIDGSKAVLFKVGEKTEQIIETSKTGIEICKHQQNRAKLIKRLGEFAFHNRNLEFLLEEKFLSLTKSIEKEDKLIEELQQQKQDNK